MVKKHVKKPAFNIHRFRVYYNRQTAHLQHKRLIKFLICGTENERMEMRIYLNYKGQIITVRCYHQDEFDGEMVGYIAKALVQKLKKPDGYQLKILALS